jgi:hypothetical protein
MSEALQNHLMLGLLIAALILFVKYTIHANIWYRRESAREKRLKQLTGRSSE